MNPNRRIFGAFLVGSGVIALAFIFAPTHDLPQADAAVEVVAGSAPARQYIPITDKDNDGIPDWREDFKQAQRVTLKKTATATGTAYTLPETLTGQISIQLVDDVVRAEIGGPFGPSQQTTINNATRLMEAAVTDELYTRNDLTIVSDNSVERLRVYGNQVASIALTEIPAGTRPEFQILQHGIKTENEEVLAELDPIIAAYTQMRDAMLEVTVPSALTNEHIIILNAYHAMVVDLTAMRGALSDPLYTMVRMKRYYQDAIGMHNGIIKLYTTLDELGITWTRTDKAAQLITTEN